MITATGTNKTSILQRLKILWQFSRPHTIIGSFFSITALFILGCKGGGVLPQHHFEVYLLTLISALACNIFITGLNQVVDVELDKINKPYLPLAAGSLSRRNALIIIYTALVICLGVALITSLFLFMMMAVILLIGIAYSVPPLQLKKHHLPAALSITLVRGFIVNLGMYIHFQKTFNDSWNIPGFAWSLAIFIMAFSVAIAWFKDIPDTEGDDRFHVKTLAVLYSRKTALRGGMILVAAAYLYILAWCFLYGPGNHLLLVICHGILLALFLLNYLAISLTDKVSIRKFYIRFWVFFFAEYTVFAVWALI